MDAPCHNSSASQLLFTLSPMLVDVRPLQTCERQRVCRSRQRLCRFHPHCPALGRFPQCTYRSHCVPISQMQSLCNDNKLVVTPLRCFLPSNTRFTTSEQPHKWAHQIYFSCARNFNFIIFLHTNKKQSILIFC